MLFKLHYFLITSGLSAAGLLLGVFMQTYTDASLTEIGAVLLIFPFSGMIFRPLICSKADRDQKHQQYLIWLLLIVAVSYSPFILIPVFGTTLYQLHPRICFYIFVLFKSCGDTAVGGVFSIGDSLAVNYAARIGTKYTVYRVWGTIAFIIFGLIIGFVNESPSFPKFVPAFMILTLSHLANALVIWLWPNEYFRIIPKSDIQTTEVSSSSKNENLFMKSLMPKEVVIDHIKRKLIGVITCGAYTKKQNSVTEKKPTVFADSAKFDSVVSRLGADHIKVDTKDNTIGKSKVTDPKEGESISILVQLRTLILLFRRDPRIILYLLYLVVAGASMVALSFFFLQLADICSNQGTCNFSQLVGFLSVSMAGCETVLFLFIQQIKDKIGRVNVCALAVGLALAKYLFYGTIYTNMDPNYAIISEGLQGVFFGIYLTLMVEIAHEFANEVTFIIPELIERGVIQDGSNLKKLEVSLAATMQAIVFSAQDGIGRGGGALIYGIILKYYSFQTLWLILSTILLITVLATLAINLFDFLFKPKFGFSQQSEEKGKIMKTSENTEADKSSICAERL